MTNNWHNFSIALPAPRLSILIAVIQKDQIQYFTSESEKHLEILGANNAYTSDSYWMVIPKIIKDFT